MSALDSVDVDGPDDFRLAEALLVSFGPRWRVLLSQPVAPLV
jgi:hypothetical protein